VNIHTYIHIYRVKLFHPVIFLLLLGAMAQNLPRFLAHLTRVCRGGAALSLSLYIYIYTYTYTSKYVHVYIHVYIYRVNPFIFLFLGARAQNLPGFIAEPKSVCREFIHTDTYIYRVNLFTQGLLFPI